MVFLKLLLLRIVIGGIVSVYPAYAILSVHPLQQPLEADAFSLTGVLLLALGAVGYLWCVWDFAFVGHSAEPNVLVARGVYRLARNPMYLSLLLVLLGESLIFRSWRLLGCAATLWLFLHLLVVLYEERTLAKKFGSSYERYCALVPRWIPSIRRAAS